MSTVDDLIEQVHHVSVPVHMRTKGEIWEYFLDKHEGDRQAAASDAARSLSGESGGRNYKNARRNFEERSGQMIGKKAGNTPKWRAFGEKLPPTGLRPPDRGYNVTFHGWILIAGEYCEMRSFTRTVTGNAAQQMVVEPALSPVFDAYFEADIADETCGEWDVTVTAA